MKNLSRYPGSRNPTLLAHEKGPKPELRASCHRAEGPPLGNQKIRPEGAFVYCCELCGRESHDAAGFGFVTRPSSPRPPRNGDATHYACGGCQAALAALWDRFVWGVVSARRSEGV